MKDPNEAITDALLAALPDLDDTDRPYLGVISERIERGIARAGLSLVPNEVLGLLSAILARGGVERSVLHQWLLNFGLATMEEFDPELHDIPGMDEGEEFMAFTPELGRVLDIAHPHVNKTGARHH